MDEDKLVKKLVSDLIFFGYWLKNEQGITEFTQGQIQQVFFTLSYLGYFEIDDFLRVSGEGDSPQGE